MSFETRDNSGSLFKNNRKAAETHADYNGNCRIDGHDYFINAWLKESRDGQKYFSLSFKRKDGTAARPEPVKVLAMKAQAPFDDDLSDEVPF